MRVLNRRWWRRGGGIRGGERARTRSEFVGVVGSLWGLANGGCGSVCPDLKALMNWCGLDKHTGEVSYYPGKLPWVDAQ